MERQDKNTTNANLQCIMSISEVHLTSVLIKTSYFGLIRLRYPNHLILFNIMYLYHRANRLGGGNGQSEFNGSESLETKVEWFTFFMERR